MANRPKIEAYVVAPGSELAEEHALITEFMKQAAAARGQHYQDIELKSVPAGRQLLDAKPDAAIRFVLAAVDQTRHWDDMAERVRNHGKGERISAHRLPGWEKVWAKRTAAAAIVRALTRRKLPFGRSDLLQLLQWCAAANRLSTYWFPIGNVARALQRFAESNELDEEFRLALRVFAGQLRSQYDNDVKRYATAIEQLIPADTEPDEAAEQQTAFRPTPVVSMAGSPAVLTLLKDFLGILPVDDEVETTAVGADAFPLRADSPIAEEHHLLSEVLEEVMGTRQYHRPNPSKLKHGKQLTDTTNGRAASLFLAAAERQVQALLAPESDVENPVGFQSRYAAGATVGLVRTRGISWTRSETFDALLYLSSQRPESRPVCEQTLDELIVSAERCAADKPLAEGERYALSLLRGSLIAGPALGAVSDEVRRLTDLIEDGASFCLTPGEAWSDHVNQDYSRWPRRERARWNTLFVHLLTATSSRPSKKWLKTAVDALSPIGEETLVACLKQWLPDVSSGRTVRQLGFYSGDTRV